MININLVNACKNILVLPLESKESLINNNKSILSVSFELDTDEIKQILQNQGVEKIYDLFEKTSYIIYMDSTPNFNSVNLITIDTDNLEAQNKYIGKKVQSFIIEFNKRQFEETTYYIKIDISEKEIDCIAKIDGEDSEEKVKYTNLINDNPYYSSFKIGKDYTKSIIDTMYMIVADNNSYTKGRKSANLYYFLQPFAKEADSLYNDLLGVKDDMFLSVADPNNLSRIFGKNLGFEIPASMNQEEYRRFLIQLYLSYLNGGSEMAINNCLQYLLGEKAEFIDFNNFYPWVLRSREESERVPEPANPSYINPESNYYITTKKYTDSQISEFQPKNKAMLLGRKFRNFYFTIKSDNFFNNEIDLNSVYKLVKLLKPAWLKFGLDIEEKQTPHPVDD